MINLCVTLSCSYVCAIQSCSGTQIGWIFETSTSVNLSRTVSEQIFLAELGIKIGDKTHAECIRKSETDITLVQVNIV